MSNESPVTEKILNYMKEKYSPIIAPIAVLKACSIISSKFPKYPRLNIMCIAPSRQFKTQTSNEMQNIFPKTFYINTGSDFTIHGFKKRYGKKINKKCIMINDGTLLFTSKSQKGKDRLINALAELLADGIYRYSDNFRSWDLTGNISCIMNITLESYMRNKQIFSESTLTERFITVFYMIPMHEQIKYAEKKEEKLKITYGKKLAKITESPIQNADKYKKELIKIATEASILSSRSMNGTIDEINAMAKAHANLNGRNNYCKDDMQFVSSILPYLTDLTAPNENKIIAAYIEGKSVMEICKSLNFSATSYVYKVLNQAKIRGIIQDKEEAKRK